MNWRWLPAALDMEHPTIVVNDIERGKGHESDMRDHFFTVWKSEKGTDATYKALISALLRIDCRKDTEYVCGIVPSLHCKKRGAKTKKKR